MKKSTVGVIASKMRAVHPDIQNRVFPREEDYLIQTQVTTKKTTWVRGKPK